MSKASPAFFRHGRQPAEGPEPGGNGNWVPNTDVFEDSARLVVRVEIAGVRREDLSLVTDGNQLRIVGCRRDRERAGGCRFLVMEIDFGCFESVVDVPAEFDLAHAGAAFENGLLTIEVPRRIKSRRAGKTKRSPRAKR